MSSDINMVEMFTDAQIRIEGTTKDPLFRCTDILVKALGYNEKSNMAWMQQIKNDSMMFQIAPRQINGQVQSIQFLTKRGVFEVMSKSDKPNAKQFRDWTFMLLEKLSDGRYELINKTLEEAKQQNSIKDKEIEYYTSLKKIGYIYRIQHKIKKEKFYVGLTEISIQQRFKDHKSSAQQSLKSELYREIFKQGLKQYEIIELEKVEYIDHEELRERESYWIKHLKAPLNNGFEFKCICGFERKQHHLAKLHKKQCAQYKHFKYSYYIPTPSFN